MSSLSNDNKSETAEILRRKAEILLKKRRRASDSIPSSADALKLIHELEVHQIELEMQNQELSQAETKIRFKNEELIKLNSEKDRFFSIISHDLRSPLSSFLCLTKVFAQDLPEMKREEIQKIANSLRDSAISVFSLIEDLLEWSRMQRGLIEFKPGPVRLFYVISKSIESLSDLASHKHQEIQLQVSEDLFVKVDLTMLESTLRNLLSNAIKFSFRSGKILIAASLTKNNFVETSITDNGIGISSGLMSKLFQIDGQTGRNGTEGEPSTGLGLLLCKEFVEKNGGNIRVESIEGKGSTFSFTLPV